MYLEIPQGKKIDIQGLICNIPPEGYVHDLQTKQIKYVGVYSRSEDPKEQYWERFPLPTWYKEVIKQEDYYNKKKGDDDEDFYDERYEAYKKQEWDRRLNGFWWMNNGEAVYLTGSHYVFLQWWFIDIGYVKFRMPDMEYFYFLQYCIEDPECMGMLEITKRRFGKTYRGGLFLYEYPTRTKMTNAGIQSKTGMDSKKLFAKAVVNPFKRLPKFFRPEYDMSLGITPKTEIRFQQTNIRGKKAEGGLDKEELGSMIDHQSADIVAYDGQKLHRYFADEWAKTVEVNVYDRHEVIRYCLLDDEGRIIGKALYSSTVEKVETDRDGVQDAAKLLWDESDQLNRMENGRTPSGLYRFFMTADRARNFDIYGIPNVEKTVQDILADRASVEHNPRALAARMRKEARTIKEAFLTDSDKCLFDVLALNDQHDWLGFNDMTEKGNLIWDNGDKYYVEKVMPDGTIDYKINKLIWVADENGEYEKVKDWMPSEMNNVYERNGHFCPNGSYAIRIGCDPFKFDKTKDSRKSNCAAYAYQMPDPLNEENPHNDMFVIKYVGRAASTDIQYDRVLKMAWFCGCKVLFERNVYEWKRYFQHEKCSGFLEWLAGEVEPGIYTGGNSENGVTQLISDYTNSYINKHIKKVYFKSLISEESGWLGFRIEDTQKFDDAMGAGIALISAKTKKYAKPAESKRTLQDIMPYKKAV